MTKIIIIFKNIVLKMTYNGIIGNNFFYF